MKVFIRSIGSLDEIEIVNGVNSVAIENEDGLVLRVSDTKCSHHGFKGFDIRSGEGSLSIQPIAANAAVALPEQSGGIYRKEKTDAGSIDGK
jgi:hypothetical protein